MDLFPRCDPLIGGSLSLFRLYFLASANRLVPSLSHKTERRYDKIVRVPPFPLRRSSSLPRITTLPRLRLDPTMPAAISSAKATWEYRVGSGVEVKVTASERANIAEQRTLKSRREAKVGACVQCACVRAFAKGT